MASRVLSLLLALLLLAACASDTGEEVGDAAADAGDVPDALQFTATTLDRTTFEGADYAGQDLMLWFWAPW